MNFKYFLLSASTYEFIQKQTRITNIEATGDQIEKLPQQNSRTVRCSPLLRIHCRQQHTQMHTTLTTPSKLF